MNPIIKTNSILLVFLLFLWVCGITLVLCCVLFTRILNNIWRVCDRQQKRDENCWENWEHQRNCARQTNKSWCSFFFIFNNILFVFWQNEMNTIRRIWWLRQRLVWAWVAVGIRWTNTIIKLDIELEILFMNTHILRKFLWFFNKILKLITYLSQIYIAKNSLWVI